MYQHATCSITLQTDHLLKSYDKKPKVASLLIISQVELGSVSDFWQPDTESDCAIRCAWLLSPHMYRCDQQVSSERPIHKDM